MDSLWLLRNWPAADSLGTVLLRHHALLRAAGLTDGMGRIRRTELVAHVGAFAGEYLRIALGIEEYQVSWTLRRFERMWERPASPTPPLYHLLLIRSLGLSVSEFFRDPPPPLRLLPRRGISLIGGPCPNPFCAEGDPGPYPRSPRRLRIGVVACRSCGFTYARRLGGVPARRLVAAGDSWEQGLRSIVAAASPPDLQDAARRLAVSEAELCEEAARLSATPPEWCTAAEALIAGRADPGATRSGPAGVSASARRPPGAARPVGVGHGFGAEPGPRHER